MQFSTRLAMSVLVVAAVGAHASAGLAQSSCSAGAVPAATLLIPYFEVDLLAADRQSTLFAVTNAGTQATLAKIVVWTDWGVPTLTFDVFLAADDVQSINLRDVFNGILPQTGGGSFTGCTNPLELPVLDATALTHLREQHTGLPDTEGNCAGSGRAGANVATGFVTIDAAQACSTLITYPGHAGYFAAGGTGIASNSNVLVGDFFLVDASQDFAQGNEAVHIVADEARFGSQPATFYGAWVAHSGVDARAPLGTRYRARYLNGGAFSGGTDLIAWSEPSAQTPQPVTCGQRPSFVDPCQFLRTTAFNENALGQTPVLHFGVNEVATRLTVGSAEIPVAGAFGFVDFENGVRPDCATVPLADFPLQSWVMPLSSASGRYSVGLNAFRTGDELCSPPVN